METAVQEIKKNGQAEMTSAQKCMREIEEILNKYNCAPICAPSKYFGQNVMVWAVEEIKK